MPKSSNRYGITLSFPRFQRVNLIYLNAELATIHRPLRDQNRDWCLFGTAAIERESATGTEGRLTGLPILVILLTWQPNERQGQSLRQAI
jgi:hypothetical protein